MRTVIDISLELANRLATYTENVKEGLEQSADEVTKEAIEKLKATSPKHKKKYAKSWVRKKTPQGYIHLLENGHAKRGGGRVAGIKHIGPVEEQTIQVFEQKVREYLG